MRIRGRGAILGAVGFLLALAAFEPFLRWFHFAPVEWHPVLGPVFQPGSVVTFRREGGGHSTWLDDGVRRAAAPASGSERIVVLGDSFTEALMLDDDQVLTARAEDLIARDMPATSLLNLGRSNRSAADYVALAPWLEGTFAPVWTVVQLQDGDVQSDAVDESKTHFRVGPGGALDLVVNSRRGPLWHALLPLRRRSSVVDLAISRLPAMIFADEAPLFRAATAATQEPPRFDMSITRAILEELRRAYAGRLTILFLPVFEPAGPQSIVPAERVLSEWSQATGTSFVNLRSAFPRFRREGRAPYGFANTAFNAGHLNADGHAAAGELLADELLRLHRRDLF